MSPLIINAAKKARNFRKIAAEWDEQLRVVCANESGTAKALAEEIGVSEQYLSDWKKGRREMSDALLARIAECKPRTEPKEEGD